VPKKTRHRQLRKQATRRMAERRARQRKKVTAIVVATLIAAGGGTFAFVALRAVGSDNAAATPTPTATAPTPTTTQATGTLPPKAELGTQIGTVTPQVAPATVACGAKAPPDVGKPKPQFAGPPPMKIDPSKTYTATIQTSCGTITIQLDATTAEQTVNSFVFLAQHQYFDGQYFHRLDTSIDVIQGGDPTGTGSGGPGYSIPDELTGSESYAPGVIAMANAGPNTGGSQFFIITGPKGHLLDGNPNYTIFGKIVSGLDVAQKIQALPIQDPQAAANGDLAGQQPKMAVYIDKVTITVK
jgi:cyclophilin family peptidyl-prolyl cis-trans isomerase